MTSLIPRHRNLEKDLAEQTARADEMSKKVTNLEKEVERLQQECSEKDQTSRQCQELASQVKSHLAEKERLEAELKSLREEAELNDGKVKAVHDHHEKIEREMEEKIAKLEDDYRNVEPRIISMREQCDIAVKSMEEKLSSPKCCWFRVALATYCPCLKP